MMKLQKLSSVGIYNGVYLCTDPKVGEQIKELESKLILPPVKKSKSVEEKIRDYFTPPLIEVKVGRKTEKKVFNFGPPPKGMCPYINDEEVLAYRKVLLERNLKERLIEKNSGSYDYVLTPLDKGLGQLLCDLARGIANKEEEILFDVLNKIVRNGEFKPRESEVDSFEESYLIVGITQSQRQTIIDVLANSDLWIYENTANQRYYQLPSGHPYPPTDATVQHELEKLLGSKS